MEIILIKTLLGWMIGKTPMKIPLDERFCLTDPVEIQYITTPVQSRIAGQMGMTTITSMLPFPVSYVHVNFPPPCIFCFVDNKSTLATQYLDTLKKAKVATPAIAH